MKDLVVLSHINTAGADACRTSSAMWEKRLEKDAPSGQAVDVIAVSSISMLLIRVDLTRSSTSRPRRVEVRHSDWRVCLRDGAKVSTGRNTADSVRRMLSALCFFCAR